MKIEFDTNDFSEEDALCMLRIFFSNLPMNAHFCNKKENIDIVDIWLKDGDEIMFTLTEPVKDK